MNDNQSTIDLLASHNDTPSDSRTVEDDVLALKKRIVFRKDGASYTVISLADDEIQMIQNNVKKFNICSVTKNYILSLYASYTLDIIDPDEIIIDTDHLSGKTKKLFETYKAIAEEAVRRFNGNYISLKSKEGTEFIKEMMMKHSVLNKIVWKAIRLYLQSGFDENALYDRRAFRNQKDKTYKVKPGRKNKYSSAGKLLTEEDEKIMDKFVRKYKSSVFSSVPQCYKDMIGDYYTTYTKNEDGSVTPEIVPPDEMPSLTQFRYYLNKKLSEKDKKMIESKRNDVSAGNASLNNADALCSVYGPTSVVEMDEQEMDLSAVSYVDPSLCIGRFIIHLIIDVQTKLVMGMSLSLDNNSVVGTQRALMNLAESKPEFCKKFGLTVSDELWPSSGCRVQSLRVDRGSEYMSKEFERICNENKITLIPTPARTASRKGTVEQQFHIFDSMWKDLLSEYGVIRKLHDSNHHSKAALDYFAVMKIIISCIIRHNISEIPNFKRSKEMIEKRVSTSPVNLWKYYDHKFHSVLPIGNTSAFLYSLMTPTKCYIGKNGVRWEGLWYSYDDFEIDQTRWKGKSVSMEVRMDRRDVSRLYYVRDGRLKIMTLNPNKTYNMDFENMPYEMYKKYREIQKELETQAREQNIRIDTINRLLVREVLGSNKRDTYANIAQISLNRTVEKNLIKSASNMFEQIKSEQNKLSEKDKTSANKPPKNITAVSESERKTDDDRFSGWNSITDEMQESERNFIKE